MFASDDKKNLDHIISAKEIHDDPGRILAERDGAELANDASNLAFTHESLNKSKKADSMDAFICTLQKNREDTLRQIAELESQATLTEKEKKRLISLRKKLMQILSVWKGLINMPGKNTRPRLIRAIT